MELCDGGDVLKKIEKSKQMRDSIKEADIWKLFVQMIRGL